MRSAFAFSAFIPALLLLSACQTLSTQAWTPSKQVEIVSMGAAFPSDSRGEVALKLRVQNVSAQRAAVYQLDWEVRFNNVYFGAGVSTADEQVDPKGQRTMVFRLLLPLKQVNVRREDVLLKMTVRGRLRLREERGGVEELVFEETKRVLARGAPVLGGMLDDER